MEATEPQRLNVSSLIGKPDLAQIPAKDEKAILDNCRDRFKQDITYSRIGPSTLIAINPFKVTSTGRSAAYDLANICDGETAPHPYDIASSAYLHMVRATEDQAIITCGESGSGKSEILKLVLQQIVHLSEQTDDQTKIHREVLEANTILECFGNAQVVSNKNSTRYSRYTEIKFNDEGTIIGQRIVEYLFESTRVAQFSEDERNFHIFYMLLSGLTREEKSKWSLNNDPKNYKFLGNVKGAAVPPEVASMTTLKASMKTLGFTKKIQNEIFQTLAGILHLGNIEFAEDQQNKGYGAYVKNRNVLETAANLFGVGPEKLENAITTSTFLSGDQVCSNFLDVAKSIDAKNGLASILYQLLFRWLIEQINNRLGSSRLGGDNFVNQIGLLDIAGFEDRSPRSNGFDQFLSNYANEKLQTFVLQRAINSTADSLVLDNVELTVEIPEAVEARRIDLFEDPRLGLFHIIDRETMSQSPFYEAGPEGWSTFKVKHYTGKAVSYNVNGFITKNRNSLYADVLNLFGITKKSTSGRQKPKSFIAGLFTESVIETILHPNNENAIVGARPAAPSKPSNIADRQIDPARKRSVMLLSSPTLGTPGIEEKEPTLPAHPTPTGQSQGAIYTPANTNTTLSQLKTSLEELIESLQANRTWSILCVRPNSELQPDKFDEKRVKEQFQALHVSAIIQASQIDYAVGIEFADFLDRYVDEYDEEEEEGETPAGGERKSVARSERKSEVKSERKSEVKSERAPSLKGSIRKSVADGERKSVVKSVKIAEDGEEEAAVESGDADEKRKSVKSQVEGSVKEEDASPENEDEDDDDAPINRGRSDRDRCVRFIEKESWTASQAVCGDTRIFLKEKVWRVLESRLDKKLEDETEGGGSTLERVGLSVDTKNAGDIEKGIVEPVKEEKEDEEEEETPKPKKKGCCGPREKKPPLLRKGRVEAFTLIYLGRMKSESVRLAWREKVALCMIVLFLSGVMLFFVQGFGKLLCQHKTSSALKNHPGVSIQGAAGTDLSKYFPRFDMVTNQPIYGRCGFIRYVDPSTLNRRQANNFDNGTHALCNTGLADTRNRRINVFQVGMLAYSQGQVREHYKVDDGWVTIKDKVYNFTALFMPDSPYRIDPAGFNIRDLGPPGGDASVNATALARAIDCFDNLFLIGYIDRRASDAGCNSSAYILYGVTGVMVSVLLIKFLAALQLAPRSYPEKNDRFVIMQVPCYNEGESSLRKTIESLATFDYDDTRKLLFIVSDGMIKSAGSDMPTSDIVLQILGVDKSVQIPEAKSYLAIAKGAKEHNKAKVYSGLYSIQARYIPFIFVMKCGREGETERPGNRGKRDSQMILMKFLNRVNFGSPMTPLELEVYHHIKDIIGVDPFLYEYCLMVDADTRVHEAALNILISCMVNDANTMGICGETQIENEKESWVTMMQVYEYYISHHLAKAFESLFGSVTCLPGCFCMYRLRTPKKVPLLIANQILNEYKDINVNTLHKQNLLSLGEDRFLTTLMLKHFPEYRNKFTPDAICFTIVPDTFNMLLGQRRRWINSTVHNLFELLFLPTLCGCLCFSMRLVVFLDLFATLIMPASTAYLGYLIYASVQAQQAPVISLIMMGAAYGLQIIIFVLKHQYQHIGWLIISILALPFFSLYIPLYAYWHFDDFKWGNTRKGAAVEEKEGHGTVDPDEEAFDPKTVPLITWEEYEQYRLKNSQYNRHSLGSTVVSSQDPNNPHNRSGSNGPSPRGQLHLTPGSEYGRSEYAESIRSSAVVRQGGASRMPVNRVGSDMALDKWVGASTDSFLMGATKPWPGGVPTDADIVRQIRYILGTSDLQDLSKRKVRETLGLYFGVDLTERKVFINEHIELALQGKI
ncbi:chitin synthase-domain-containing protein [Chytridium lagenaria]|nr:chitin synthase-domain-containing protein [Chytridium lagenaria]